MFKLQASLSYKDSLDKLVKTDVLMKKRLTVALKKLSLDPTHPSLRSHKVNTPDHGICWSSRVTGDIRIIWDYDSSKRLVILLIDIGRHSGSRKVYK